MEQSVSVLMLDDGELDELKPVLRELGAEFLHLRGGSIPAHVSPPTDLLLTTARRARLAETWSPGKRPVKIAFVDEDSNTLRSMLRRIGFDFLIRRPVHPYALRLLIQRALYAGDEKRREQRVAIGAEISYRAGFRRKTATLADLSLRGGRLLMPQPQNAGTRITLQLPREITNGGALSLRAKILRCQEIEPGQHETALFFEKVTIDQRRRIAEVMKHLASGPARLEGEVSRRKIDSAVDEVPVNGTPATAVETPVEDGPSEVERREQKRAAWGGEVMHLDDVEGRVLFGRDLSAGGMRVEARDDLEVGASLRLAIYGAAREEPFIVRARVARNDGGGGVALQFEPLGPAVTARIEKMVASLPPVESLTDGEAEGLGNVVSEVLEQAAPNTAGAA